MRQTDDDAIKKINEKLINFLSFFSLNLSRFEM